MNRQEGPALKLPLARTGLSSDLSGIPLATAIASRGRISQKPMEKLPSHSHQPMKTSRIQWMLALAASITTASAQPPRGNNRREQPQPPVPPFFAELDVNRDRALSEEEMQSAFKTLDKNRDGEITLDELMPPPDGGKPPRKPKEPKGPPQGPDGPPPNKPPVPPLIAALDADHDGTISAEELANAPESLKELDKNGDGQLNPEELRPIGPPPPPDGARNEGAE